MLIHGLVEGHIPVREAQGGADQEATHRGRDQGQGHRHGGEAAIEEGLARLEVLEEGDEAQATVATAAIVKGVGAGAGIGLAAGGDPGAQLITCTLLMCTLLGLINASKFPSSLIHNQYLTCHLSLPVTLSTIVYGRF